MIKLQLRSGNGGVVVKAQLKPTQPKKLTKDDLAAIRAAREAQFELEAELEGAATKRHRQLAPAHETRFKLV